MSEALPNAADAACLRVCAALEALDLAGWGAADGLQPLLEPW